MATDPKSIPAALKDPLTEPRNKAKSADAPGFGGSSWPSVVALLFLAFNCCAAIYHTRHDPWSVAFVVASFAILVTLFYIIHVYDTLPQRSAKRVHVKAAVWALSSVLTVMFAHRVAALLPFPVAVVVWLMAGATTLAGFYMLLVCRDKVVPAEEKPGKVADIA